MTSSTTADRYYVTDALLYNDPDTPDAWKIGRFPDSPCQLAKVALVGLHIVYKIESNPLFVWATFEHVDNVTPPPGGSSAAPRGSRSSVGGLQTVPEEVRKHHHHRAVIAAHRVGRRERVGITRRPWPQADERREPIAGSDPVGPKATGSAVAVGKRVDTNPFPVADRAEGEHRVERTGLGGLVTDLQDRIEPGYGFHHEAREALELLRDLSRGNTGTRADGDLIAEELG